MAIKEEESSGGNEQALIAAPIQVAQPDTLLGNGAFRKETGVLRRCLEGRGTGAGAEPVPAFHSVIESCQNLSCFSLLITNV